MTSKAAWASIATALAASWVGAGLAAQTPAFDAVSVRAVKHWSPYDPPSIRELDPGRFCWTGAIFADVITWAWSLNRFELRRKPDWIVTDRFTIQAEAATLADQNRMQAIMRRYLAGQLGMRFHYAATAEETYVLLVAPEVGKLKAVPMQEGQWRGGDPIPLSALASLLGGIAKSPVLDETCSTGRFDVFAALGRAGFMLRKLGLRLRPERTTIRALVVDALERPAAHWPLSGGKALNL